MPRCQSVTDLTSHVDQWWGECQEHAADWPAELLFEMFMQMLPQDVETEMRRIKDIATIQQAYAYIQAEQGRLNSERLARVHEQRRKQELEAKPQEAYINALNAENTDIMEQLIAAMEKRLQNRKPDAARPTSQISDPKWETAHAGSVAKRVTKHKIAGSKRLL